MLDRIVRQITNPVFIVSVIAVLVVFRFAERRGLFAPLGLPGGSA